VRYKILSGVGCVVVASLSWILKLLSDEMIPVMLGFLWCNVKMYKVTNIAHDSHFFPPTKEIARFKKTTMLLRTTSLDLTDLSEISSAFDACTINQLKLMSDRRWATKKSFC